MSSKIASRVRRRLLAAGAGALGFPVVSQAFGGLNAVMKTPVWPAQTPGQAIESLAAQPVEGHADAVPAWAGERFVLSGRLTEPNGAAIARAVIGQTSTGMTTLSDADGRFMLITTAPARHHLDLQLTAPSGQTLQKVVPLLGQIHPSAPNDSMAATGRYAHQRVWRSSVSLSITT